MQIVIIPGNGTRAHATRVVFNIGQRYCRGFHIIASSGRSPRPSSQHFPICRIAEHVCSRVVGIRESLFKPVWLADTARPARCRIGLACFRTPSGRGQVHPSAVKPACNPGCGPE